MVQVLEFPKKVTDVAEARSRRRPRQRYKIDPDHYPLYFARNALEDADGDSDAAMMFLHVLASDWCRAGHEERAVHLLKARRLLQFYAFGY